MDKLNNKIKRTDDEKTKETIINRLLDNVKKTREEKGEMFTLK